MRSCVTYPTIYRFPMLVLLRFSCPAASDQSLHQSTLWEHRLMWWHYRFRRQAHLHTGQRRKDWGSDRWSADEKICVWRADLQLRHDRSRYVRWYGVPLPALYAEIQAYSFSQYWRLKCVGLAQTYWTPPGWSEVLFTVLETMVRRDVEWKFESPFESCCDRGPFKFRKMLIQGSSSCCR